MPTSYSVVYTWPDGQKEVRYTRPCGDWTLYREVQALRTRHGDQCPYSIEWGLACYPPRAAMLPDQQNASPTAAVPNDHA